MFIEHPFTLMLPSHGTWAVLMGVSSLLAERGWVRVDSSPKKQRKGIVQKEKMKDSAFVLLVVDE